MRPGMGRIPRLSTRPAHHRLTSTPRLLAAVSEGRKMPVDDVKKLADGRIYTGRQGKENGLVDQIGDLQDALDAAGEMGGIGKTPRVLKESDPFEQIMSLMDSKLQLTGTKALAEAMDVTPSLEYRWYGH